MLNPLVKSNWSYSPETLNSGQNRRFFLSRVTLKFDGWPWKVIGHLLYTTPSFVHHFKAIGELKLELQSANAQFGSKSAILLCYFKLCASFHSHQWVQAGVTVRKRYIRVKSGDFFVPCDLEIWRMTLKINRAPLLSTINLCVSFHNHMQIQTGVTVRK